MITLKKTIAYTTNLKHVFWISLLLGMLIPTLLMTLEPFDNSNHFDYKYFILSGYSLCIIAPILIVHPLENYFYNIQKKRWFVINEFFYIMLTLFIIFICSFLYHFYAVSGLNSFTSESIWVFIKSFGVPFIPVLIPLWLYLRSKYGLIEVATDDKTDAINTITIVGSNNYETLTIFESDFIFAKAQQNYVDIYFNTERGTQQKTFRSTLSNIMKQLPKAYQVHRSYLVNLNYLKSIEGNSRQSFINILGSKESIPISKIYYKSLKERLLTSTEELQN